jgi:hypothetical protein
MKTPEENTCCFSPCVGALAAGAGLASHAWVCLGKLCLADEQLAKKCTPLFVQVGRIGEGGGRGLGGYGCVDVWVCTYLLGYQTAR